MKKSRALALLLAAGLSASTVSQLPVAIAQEAPAQTMAEIYQPYYEYIEARTDEYVIATPEGEYPTGTMFEIYRPNFPSYEKTSYEDGPLITTTSRYGRVHVSQVKRTLPNYKNDGYTTSPQLLVTYPDSSVEIITVTVKVTSTTASFSEVLYPVGDIEPGTSRVISPIIKGDSPASYSLVQLEELKDFRARGWEFSIDTAEGNLSITTPDTEGEEIYLPINVTYADGSNELTHISSRVATATVPEPEPEPQPEPQPTPRKGGSSFGSSS